MITKELWNRLVFYTFFTSCFKILTCLLLSFITIPLDIILSPLEVIAYIIQRIIYREED